MATGHRKKKRDILIVHNGTTTCSSTTSRPGNSKDDAGIAPALPKKKSHGLFPFGGTGDRSLIQNNSSLPLSAQQPRGTSGRKNRAHVQISSAAPRNAVCNAIYCPHLICVNLGDVVCKTSWSKSNFYLVLDSFLPSVANGVTRGDRHSILLQRTRAAWLCVSPQHY